MRHLALELANFQLDIKSFSEKCATCDMCVAELVVSAADCRITVVLDKYC